MNVLIEYGASLTEVDKNYHNYILVDKCIN